MPANWYRIGNFYQTIDPTNNEICLVKRGITLHYILHGVILRNAGAAIITEIFIAKAKTGIIGVSLTVSDTHFQNVLDLIISYFPTHRIDSYGRKKYKDISFSHHTIDVNLQRFESFQAFLHILAKNDEVHFVREFTQALSIELHRIYQFATDPERAKFKQHIIPLRARSQYAHVNPARDRTNNFKDVFWKGYVDVRKLKKLLISGEDPNYRSESDADFPPIIYSMQYHQTEVLELLLCYGADPFHRPDINAEYMNAIEFGFQHGHHDKLDLIFRNLSYIHREPSRGTTEIPTSNLIAIDKSVNTIFEFKTKLITTELKRLSDFSPSERAASLLLFKNCFDGKAENSAIISDIFYADFQGDNKLVETIYGESKEGKNSRRRLIGVNLFELLNSKTHDDHIDLHCVYSLVDPVARSIGLMTFLNFRLAFALQLLLHDYRVGVYFSSASHNSWMMIKDILHYPMYQTDLLGERVNVMLDKIYEGKANLQHDVMTCYITESVTVKQDFLKKPEFNNIFFNLFYQQFLNLNPDVAPQNPEMRAAPVFFYVGDESNAFLTEKAAALGIDFQQHTLILAQFFLNLFIDMLGSKKIAIDPTAAQRSLNALFYSNQIKPGLSPLKRASQSTEPPLPKSKM